jgi:4-oxalocrotonate tautomerase
MPKIFFEMLEGRTVEQKRTLAEELTKIVVDILEVPAEDIDVRFINVKYEDLARGGRLFLDRE